MNEMFIMTEEDLAYKIPVFTYQYDSPSKILINENCSPYSIKKHPFEIIITENRITRYSNAITQIGNDLHNLNDKVLLKNASTVTELNLSNSQIRNENQHPEIIKNSDFIDNDIKYSDDENMFNNETEEEDIDDEDDDEILENNSNQSFLLNNFIPSNSNPNANILISQNSLNSNKILISSFKRLPKKNRISLTPEARKFRDSFYKCYGDKKRFSKLVVRNIHNSICGALGLPRMSRSEYRSILLYFNNYAPYRQKIIQAINMKKGFLLDPLDGANAGIFSLH